MGQVAAVELRNVGVSYGRNIVLDDVSMAVSAGELVGIRGVNGSGKTTLLRLLVNAYRPNFGERIGPRRSAYVPATIEPPAISAKTWLHGVPRSNRGDAGQALDLLGFEGGLNAGCRELSFGNLRKLLLAEAFTSGEKLIVVDEASTGLDEAGLHGLSALIEKCRAASTAVVLADQQSRPFPDGAMVYRVANSRIHTEREGETTTLTLQGPLGARQALVDQARELGFTARGES